VKTPQTTPHPDPEQCAPASRALGGIGGIEQGLALVMTLFVVALVTVLVLEYHFDAAVEIDWR